MTTARQLLAQIAQQRREAALHEAILLRLWERGRILPGEEIHREPFGNGAVTFEMPEP